MATGALLALSMTLPSPQACAPGTVTPASAHTRSAPAGHQPACATQQGKPGKTSQGGAYAH